MFSCCLCLSPSLQASLIFFFTDPATTEIYTLSLHDAFRSSGARLVRVPERRPAPDGDLGRRPQPGVWLDRKSTRLNSSHRCISYAVFCLKKKNLIKSLIRSITSSCGHTPLSETKPD